MFHDPDFLPFTPRETPSFLAITRNFLENYSPSAYRSEFWTSEGIWPLVPRTHYVASPELIEEMLVARADAFPRDALTNNALSGPIDRDSLFFSEGVEWKWQRRAVAPAFRHEKLLGLVPIFSQCARAQADEWRNLPAGETIDVMGAMSRTTFGVIQRAVFGASEDFEGEAFLAALGPVLASIGWRMLIALFSLPAKWTPHPGYFSARAAMRRLHEETAKLLAARRRVGGTERPDILGLLLSAKDPETGRVMTDAELIANLHGFLLAGHETAAVALGWSLWLLAKDQASQQRVRDEVARVAGAGEIGPEAVEQLVFTRQVLQEAMRLFPPAAAIGRQPREDTPLGPHRVAKNEPIYILVWCLHRHENLWAEPHAFDPDRFAPDQVKARRRYAYLPFGAGPRICIGMGFALLEMATILATLVRDFRFESVPGHRLELAPVFTTRPKGALPLTIVPAEAPSKSRTGESRALPEAGARCDM